ncbi:MAG: serine/threonine protein kinase [Myxococcales bacterium]|nr:serine/threonine protein kinase [Myxococcales bacterium]
MVAADVAPLVLGDTVLERYRTIELIAKGGHSVVYRGKDERLERPVCIKVFTSVPGDAGIAQTSYEHFVQEAFALSRLTHPHTLRIYDFGHLGEATPFHVSEYMNGGTLTTQVKEHGRLDAAETLKVTRAMCDALAEAHSLGIVHRDVKPHNILFAMVGSARLAKLADFGVAKWHEHATATASSPAARAGDTQVVSGQRMAMYSPSWAAPEQLAGQGVSAATDIYSLALVAVYMLTGRAIFADDDLYEGYRKRRHSDELVAEALAAVELPAPARDLLARALRFHPDERPDDATLFGVELAEAFEPITGPLARLPEATGRAPSPVELVPLPAEPAPPRPSRPPPTRRLAVGAAFEVAKRRGAFAAMTNGQVDVTGLGGTTRVRVTLLPPTGGRRQVHLKGLSSFLGKKGGRPSVAVQLDGDAMLDLYGRGNVATGRLRVSFGTPAAGHTVFHFGDESVAVAVEECPDAVLVDFGGGAECALVYSPVYNPMADQRRRRRT